MAAAPAYRFQNAVAYNIHKNAALRFNMAVIHMFPYPVQKVLFSRERLIINGRRQPHYFSAAVPSKLRVLSLEGYAVPQPLPKAIHEVPTNDHFYIRVERERKIREKMKEMPMVIAQFRQERRQQSVERQERKLERARKLQEFMEAEKQAIMSKAK